MAKVITDSDDQAHGHEGGSQGQSRIRQLFSLWIVGSRRELFNGVIGGFVVPGTLGSRGAELLPISPAGVAAPGPVFLPARGNNDPQGELIVHLEHAVQHLALSRRKALKLGAAGLATAAAGPLLASPAEARGRPDRPPGPPQNGDFNDDMFDVDDVVANGWGTSPYGPDDQLGTWNEVTPRKSAQALRGLNSGRPIKTYDLSEEMFNGFPAFPSVPPRNWQMQTYVLGYEPPPSFGGIIAGTVPLGPNLLTGHEERFEENYTFQIATQIDGLNHVGTGTKYYNNNDALDFVGDGTQTTALGNETMRPITTRGIIIDVVGLKVEQGHTDDLITASNGEAVLVDDYRITVEDIEASLRRQRVRHAIGPGDMVILRTGWTHIKDDPDRYLAQEPGIYLRECRYLATKKPALVGSDTWGMELRGNPLTAAHGDNLFPCHQEFLGKHGIRIGESWVTDDLVHDGNYDVVIMVNPQNAPGATCGSTPPVALANI